MIALTREMVAKLRNAGNAIVLVIERHDTVTPIADRVAYVENGAVALREGAQG